METVKNINLTKKERERMIKGKIKLYGYSYGEQPMKVDRNFRDVVLLLNSVPEVPSYFSLFEANYDKSSAIFFAKQFFQHFFTLHDVRMISHDDFENAAYRCLSDKVSPLELLDLCDNLESLSRMVSPFDLPITYIENDQVMCGITQKPMFIKNNDKFLKKQHIYFSGIHLGEPISSLTSYTYIHEITHTQVESVKGSVRDYHHREVLPILLELIAGYEMDTSKHSLLLMIRFRLRDILGNMALLYKGNENLYELLEDTIYVKSTLQALHLFDIYSESSEVGKRDMIKGIQEIFDGKLVLENFMMKYGVDFNKSSEVSLVRKIVKKYK